MIKDDLRPHAHCKDFVLIDKSRNPVLLHLLLVQDKLHSFTVKFFAVDLKPNTCSTVYFALILSKRVILSLFTVKKKINYYLGSLLCYESSKFF